MIQASILSLLLSTTPSASVVQQLLQISINASKVEEIFKENIKENTPINVVMNGYYSPAVILKRHGQSVNVLQKDTDIHGTYKYLNVEKIKVTQDDASVLLTYGTLKITLKIKCQDGVWVFVSSYIKNKGKRNWNFEF